MRVVFMGTPDFSVPTLEKIIEAGHEVIGVVTQPDKAKGRGKKVLFPPVKETALAHNLPVYQPRRARDPEFIEEMKTLNPDVMVVVAFGQILPKAILDIPKYGCINVHASLLPKYRGAAPIQWAVIRGEKVSGVTTMQMDVGLDTGDMLLKKEVLLDEEETGGSLHDKLSTLGGNLLIETLEKIEAGDIHPEKQDDSQAGEYARMLDKNLGRIDFSMPAAEIERLIRGLNPWPSAFTSYNGKTMKLWKAKADNCGQGVPGQVIHVDKNSFTVQTGQGTLQILELQMEGKKRMDAGAFLRGCPLETGTMLGQE
ncbi:MAG: methionyl-tRNA formyltransferase [Frisingicoccus sp.]|uniref:methionyl-tRNA formyltransferase n=1 Tax=Frisingicoccus sp. TaxID=1918627 RepID=UPI0026068E1D|nr:methionyl-tRNA formyltransferase [Frisingicoccus sp.]MDD6233460.1 methionyl-tRNA formyltransferase [Frisingicoccus sp.]MDY4834742.1 methionyl-tRNA formyltransferase [Frisingicoccus sp.]